MTPNPTPDASDALGAAEDPDTPDAPDAAEEPDAAAALAARPLVTPRRAAVAAAVVAGVVVLGLLGWLLWPHQAGRTVLYAGTARYAATVTVASARVGTTDVTVVLTDRAGAPVGNAALLLQATQPLMGMATPAIPATSTGTGSYDASGVPLMMTGPWQLLLTITGPTGTVDTLQVPLNVTG